VSGNFEDAAGGADLSFAALFDGPILDLDRLDQDGEGDGASVLPGAGEAVAADHIRDGQVIDAGYAVISVD